MWIHSYWKRHHDMSGNVSNGLLATNSENAFLLKFTVILTTPLKQLIISFEALFDNFSPLVTLLRDYSVISSDNTTS